MTRFLCGFRPGLSFRLVPPLAASALLVVASGPRAAAESLVGVTKVKFNAAVPTVAGKVLSLSNVRVKSITTTTADYVSAEFKFDTVAFRYDLQNARVFRGVGIFAADTGQNAFFARDVPEDVTLLGPAGQRYSANQYFKLNTAGETFTMDLKLGQVVSFIFGETNDSFTFEFRDPDGRMVVGDETPSMVTVNQGGGVNSGPLPVFRDGRYTLKLTPRSKPSLAVTVGFLQGNRRPLATLQNGGSFSGNLVNGLTDYAKYIVNLNQGDVLTTQLRASRQITTTLVSSRTARSLTTPARLAGAS